MPELKDIPDEVKWRIAADCAARIPALYDRAFRDIVGKRYDGIEQEIWMELARTGYGIARDLSLPTRNARELAETMRFIMTILFGPGYRSEVLELSHDGAVTIVKKCPLLTHGLEPGCASECMFHKCMALTLTTIPLLNRKYSARYVRTICTGDRQCEIKVEINKEPDTLKDEQKKTG